MDPKLFENQLKRTEDTSIDFKRTQYDFSGASKTIENERRAKFVKDLLCMWNTPRDEPAYLVLGVECQPNGSKILHGVAGHIDDAELRGKLEGWVFPIPNFQYQPVQYDGHEFAVLVIPPDPTTGPCMPVRDVGGMLRKYQVYCRRGSQNVEANQTEQHAIYMWFRQASQPMGLSDTGDVAWDALLKAMHYLEPDYHYLLAAGPLMPSPGLPLKNLGRLGWAWVADFDPDSDRSGLLHECRPEIEANRALHVVVRGNRITPNIDRGTYWYYAMGRSELQASLINGPWKVWKQAYDHDIRQQLLALAQAGNQKPFVLLVIWHDDALGLYLEAIIDAAISAIGAAIQIVVLCPAESVEIRRLEQRYDLRVITIPLHHACHGFGALKAGSATTIGASCEVPSASGAPISIQGQEYYWLSEELDIVDLKSGRTIPADRVLGRDFLRGHEISWNELGLHYDVDRDLTEYVQNAIELNLGKRRASRLSLYHMPGAGGTTVARRILWNLHRKYPSSLLRRTTPGETTERVARLAALTGLPVLLVIDAGVISDREMDALYEFLAARQLPVVMLQVIRRFSPSGSKQPMFLSAVLSVPDELNRFVHFLSREVPAKSSELAKAAASANNYEHTPFYMALLVFGRDFVGLDNYIRRRVENLCAAHARVIVYLALAHYYGQRTVPAQAFADLLQLPPERRVDLARALPEETRELLVNAEPGQWRSAHPLVAEACLSHLLSPGVSEPNVWKQRLSDWAKEFITFCRGSLPVSAETELDLAERVFVYRDNSELLGTERAGSAQFAQLIEDVPSDEGRLEVLRHLTAVFPENAHFWAHLGRFYSMKMKEFSQAVKAINQALALQPDDHTLHHMKGMAIRNEAYELIANRQPLTEVVRKAEDASKSFVEARRLNPEDEYGYISETQMIIKVLDYAGSSQNGDAMLAATGADAPAWLRQSVQAAEDLLDQVRRNHPDESPSNYEERCRADLSDLYGDHDRALQRWGNVLNRKDIYPPPVRRQMVWTYLARRRRKWADLSSKDIRRVVELLGQNMDQEPQDPRNLRLWFEAIRHIQPVPTLETVIEKLAYWKASTGGIEPTYYLYVMYALKTIPSANFAGSTLARDQARRILEECKGLARNRRNRTKSFEWLGPGEGLERLVRQERLGIWNRDFDFWTDVSPLLRIDGIISRIHGPEAGEIEIAGGLTAFFVPARSGHMKGRSENSPVTCFIGFSYDGLRAWSVQNR